MATSMALGGASGIAIGLNNSSPIIGGGLNIVHNNGSIGNLTPSHAGIKYCSTGGGSATSSVHSPISTANSTPNNAVTIINSTTSGSVGKCGSENISGPGSIGSSNDSSGNISYSSSNTQSSDIFGSKCKRKINFSNLGMPARAHQPATVARRNARERNRVKQVNNGFAALKQHIPLGHRSKKMSKVETLRCAVEYIRNLQGMLNIHGSLGSSSPAGSSTSGDIILIDDENQEQQMQPTSHNHHHQQQQQQQHQMNGVNNQRDAFALSSSSSSSSPTSSDFGASIAHLHNQISLIQSHHTMQHPQQHHLANNNTNNQLRHLSLSHNQLHGNNGVSVATSLVVDNNSSMTPNSNQLSPTSSEDPSSPYASEASSYLPATTNLKYEYDNYEPVSPEDEELLDAIAWWQQS